MNFDRIRALLLDRAIRGELVPQLANECTTDRVGVAPEDVLFEIPRSWKWSYLKDICNALSDGSHNPPPNAGKGIPVLSAKNIFDSQVHVETASRWVTEEQWELEDKKIHIECGDVLLTIVGTIGRTAVVGNVERFMLQRSVCVIKPKNESVDSRYLALMLTAPMMFQWLMDRAAGTAQKGVYLRTLKGMPLPIPPIEEQTSIVTKLEEAFAEIDRAEKAYEELQTLAGVLRGQILQEAIQGKLVPQLAEEGVVEQIGAVTSRIPFTIPEKWKWVQLKSVGQIVGGGTPKTSVADYWGDEISWVTPADLGKNSSKWIHSGAKSITRKGLDESSAKLMPEGSVVYSSRAPIGHIAIAGQELCTNQGCKSFVPNTDLITTEWAYYTLIARTKDIQSRASGTTFKEISGKGMGETWIALPPLGEQQRIVTKIEDLLNHVDALTA